MDEVVHIDDDELGDPRFGYRGCTMQLHRTLLGYRCREIEYAWRDPAGSTHRATIRIDTLHPEVLILVKHPEWTAWGRNALAKVLTQLVIAIETQTARDLAGYEAREAFIARQGRAEAYRRRVLGERARCLSVASRENARPRSLPILG